MRIAYADPPYPGMSGLYKDHPDYGGEVDHAELVEQMREFDAWILHTASTTLLEVWNLCPEARCAAWTKPFASWKKNVYPAYAWEPVLFSGGRNVFGERQTVRDYCAESITLKRGLTGAKPEAVCWWAFDLVGAEPDDELVDLFPGTGAVSRAWESYRATPRIEFPFVPEAEPFEAFEGNAPRRSESEAHKPGQIQGGV
jgi:hypothetical protein